jgi:hypothetical protein
VFVAPGTVLPGGSEGTAGVSTFTVQAVNGLGGNSPAALVTVNISLVAENVTITAGTGAKFFCMGLFNLPDV